MVRSRLLKVISWLVQLTFRGASSSPEATPRSGPLETTLGASTSLLSGPSYDSLSSPRPVNDITPMTITPRPLVSHGTADQHSSTCPCLLLTAWSVSPFVACCRPGEYECHGSEPDLLRGERLAAAADWRQQEER